MQRSTIAVVGVLATLGTGSGVAAAAERGGGASPSLRFQERLADERGVSGAKLAEATKDAATGTVRELRQNGRLDQRRAAALERRIEAGRAAPFARLDGRGGRLRRVGLGAAAKAMGIEREELAAALRRGETPAEIIAARGANRGEVAEAVRRAVRNRLERRVERGRLSAERADARARKVAKRLTGERLLRRVPAQPSRAGER